MTLPSKLLNSLLLFIAGAVLALAADPTGTITGIVTDPTGGAVAGAKVTVTALNTGLSRTATTANDGGFVFPLMPVGAYSVTVEVSGFRRFEQRGVELRADSSTSVPVTLQIGSVAETVTVEASAEMVETRSGTLSNVVGQQKIIELPLNGRNAAALITLAPAPPT
jgi:hypothetical protein